MNIKKICLISGFLLLLAIPSGLPYVYYQFLRLFIFGISGYIAWEFHKSNLPAWMVIFGSVALIFNPLIPFYLAKSTWVGIDLIAAILFFLAGYSAKRRQC